MMHYSPHELGVRNQALISMANDVGARISELLTLNLENIREVKQDERTFLVISIRKSKTKTRTVIGYLCMPYVKRWLAQHKDTKNKNAPLFVDRFGNRLPYTGAKKVLERALKKTGLALPERKKMHIFRHLLATRTKDWPASCRNVWFGWSEPNEAGRYTHLEIEDLAPHYFSMLEKERNPMMPKQCNCGAWNNGGDFCIACGKDLKAWSFLNNKDAENRVAKIVLEEIDETQLENILAKVLERRSGVKS